MLAVVTPTGVAGIAGGTLNEGSAYIITMVFRGGSGTSSLRIDGDVTATKVNMGDMSFPNINLGGNLNEDQGIDGLMGDVVMYSNANDITKVEGYIAHKWGLSGSLPSNHAYKSAPPTM